MPIKNILQLYLKKYLYKILFLFWREACRIWKMKRKAEKGKSKSTRKKVRQGDYQRGRELARTPKAELKAFDSGALARPQQLVATPPTYDFLNCMVNGAELHQRVGRKIYMKSLHLHGAVTGFGASINQQSFGRIIIFYDAQPNAAAPTIAGLLQDANAGGATNPYSHLNLTNRQRFKILRDYRLILGPTNANALVTNINDPIKNSYLIDIFIKLRGLEAIYNGTNGGTIADITSGSIGVTFISDSGAATDYELLYSSRLRYYD